MNLPILLSILFFLSLTHLPCCFLPPAAGIVAIDLARQMLQLLPNTYVLVVSTENITQNWYFGNTKSMLIPNCLFRVGGAAMLLSNKRREGWYVPADCDLDIHSVTCKYWSTGGFCRLWCNTTHPQQASPCVD